MTLMRASAVPVLFIALWFLLALVPAGLAELTSDEGYYWFYAMSLQWGYYDHPPFLALMTKVGTLMFPGELGVRFFTAALSTLGLLIVFTLLPRDRGTRWTAFVIVLSLPLLNYLSVVVMPDGPLMFFSVVFLYAYKRFLDKEDRFAVILLGVAMALMAYSKYHGALVVLFTVLSNPSLLRSRKFHTALLVALIGFLPHLWWQYQNHFVTFEYHIRGRATGLTTRYLFEYLSQQVIAISPGLIFVPFVVKTRDPFERALKFISIGTLGFFLLATLRGFVHTHWTSIALYPIILLAVPFYRSWSTRIWFYALFVPFGVALLLLRTYLVYPIFPITHMGIDYYHDRDAWAEDIRDVAGDDRVLFPENFRQAPLYSFYSGRTGVALFRDASRQSQYELWQYEDSLQGTSVTWVQGHVFAGADSLRTRMGPTVYHAQFADFSSYNNIMITADAPDTIEHGRDTLPVMLTILNHRSTALAFPTTPAGEQPRLVVRIMGQTSDTAFTLRGLSPADAIEPETSRVSRVDLPVAFLESGRYRIAFAIHADPLSYSWNSEAAVFTVD